MHWTWDARKDLSNRRKHGLPVEIRALALIDPMALTVPDPHPDDDRWNTIGMVDGALLFVVHTWPDDDEPGRIISVRRAARIERMAYEEGKAFGFDG